MEVHPPVHPSRPAIRALALAASVTLLAAACTTGSASPAPAQATPEPSARLVPTPSASVAPSTAPAARPLTVGLGYIPSVQFAQFYLADQAGYYRDAGLNVTFQNEIDADLVPAVGQGAIDIGIVRRHEVIPAVSQGIPIVYVATVYGQFPSIVFAKARSGSRRPPT